MTQHIATAILWTALVLFIATCAMVLSYSMWQLYLDAGWGPVVFVVGAVGAVLLIVWACCVLGIDV